MASFGTKYYTKYFISGTNTPNSSKDYRYYFVVTETTNKSANTSTITVKGYVQTHNFPYLPGKCEVTVGINTNSMTSQTAFGGQGSASILVGTFTKTITHNADGSGSVNIYCMGYKMQDEDSSKYNVLEPNSGYPLKYTLTRFYRPSSITNTTTSSSRATIGSTSVTFTMSRKVSSYTHDLKYTINGTTYTIGTGLGTSKSYAFPTSIINQLTTSATPNITVSCVTKSGSSTIGTTTTTVYLKVPDSYVPTCSLAISDLATIPSSWGLYVKNQSKIQGVVTAAGSSGSTISSYTSKGNGQTFTTSTFTTSELTTSGTNTITTTVKDSRGRTATDSKTIEVVDYWTPTLSNFEIKRCDANGKLVDEGTYGKVVCNYSIAPVNNLNNKSLQVTYDGTTKTFELNDYNGTFTATDLFSDLATNNSHTFIFKIIDSFYPDGVPYAYTMTPAYTTESKLAGGRGITLGRVATEEGFNVYMPTNIYGELIVSNEDGSNEVNILEKIKELETGEVDLTEYIKKSEVSTVGKTGRYMDLIGQPTKVSSFENDKGYLTSIPSEYVTETELNNKGYITSVPEQIFYWDGQSGSTNSSNIALFQQIYDAWAANKKIVVLAKISDSKTIILNEVTIDGEKFSLGYTDTVAIKSDVLGITSIYSYVYSGEATIKNNQVSLVNTLKKTTYTIDPVETEKDPTVPSHVKNITSNDITNWNNKSEFSGNYNDLTNKPTIPTVENSLTSTSTTNALSAAKGKELQGNLDAMAEVFGNNMDYIISAIPTDNKQLTNGAGYLTTESDPTVPSHVKSINTSDISNWNGKQEKLVSGTNIKTINGTTILGSGNIDIDSGISEITSNTNIYDLDTGFYYVNQGVTLTCGTSSIDETTTTLTTETKSILQVVAMKNADYSIYEIYYTLTTVNFENESYCLIGTYYGHILGVYFDAVYWVSDTPFYLTLEDMQAITKRTTSISSSSSDEEIPTAKAVYDYITSLDFQTQINSKQATLVSGTNIKTINGQSLLGAGNIAISSGGTATDVQVNGTSITSSGVANLVTQSAYNSSTNKLATKNDIPTNNNQLTNGAGYITGISSSMVTSALGYTPYNSTNPNGYTSNTGTITGVSANGTSVATSGVANIPAATTSKYGVTKLSSSTSSTSTSLAATPSAVKSAYDLANTANEQATANATALNNKVDKVDGKGLSTNDYTTAEQTKLANIETGANKTIVNNTLTSDSTTEALSAAKGKELQENFDGLVEVFGQNMDYISSAIPTNNNQLTNGAGYQTASDVDNIVSTKQDTLVSGTNIKTINGESLLGSGDITIEGGSSGGLTATVLYENSAGTNGTVSLSASSRTFSYIEIYFGAASTSGSQNCVKYDPLLGANTPSLVYDDINGSGLSTKSVTKLSCSTKSFYVAYYYTLTKTATEESFSLTNNIYVKKVVGYK